LKQNTNFVIELQESNGAKAHTSKYKRKPEFQDGGLGPKLGNIIQTFQLVLADNLKTTGQIKKNTLLFADI
jgi:hypothetical protein